jgi:hypothetical protein
VRAVLTLVLFGIVAGGCGIAVPATTDGGASTGQARQPSPRPAQAWAAGHTPRPPARQPDPYHSPLAAEALVAFATEYINWNSHTVTGDMRLLATQSVGQAHSAMELAAGETARDYELHRGGIANHGQVEGVAPCSGPGGRWVIVTRESTTSTASNAYQGLAPAWHVIVAKAVELRPGRWAISLWQPES